MHLLDKNGMAKLGILFLVFILIVFVGCSTGRSHSRGSLSNVMDKASDDYEGEREVETEWEKPKWQHHHDNDDVEISADILDDEAQPDSYSDTGGQSFDGPWYFGISGSYGLVENDDFNRMKKIGIILGQADSKMVFEGFVGGEWASVKALSETDQSIESNIVIFNAALNIKYFPSGSYTSNNVEPYLLLGLGYRYMYWDYENDVYTSGGEKITFDTLDGYDLHAGVGINIPASDKIKMGLELIPSVTLWGDLTHKGFTNDVFKPFYDVRMRMLIMFPSN